MPSALDSSADCERYRQYTRRSAPLCRASSVWGSANFLKKIAIREKLALDRISAAPVFNSSLIPKFPCQRLSKPIGGDRSNQLVVKPRSSFTGFRAGDTLSSTPCAWKRDGWHVVSDRIRHIRGFRASRGRRSALSATARLLGCCVALGFTLSVSSVLAGPHLLDGSTQVCWIGFGASGPKQQFRCPPRGREMAPAGARCHEEWQSGIGRVLH